MEVPNIKLISLCTGKYFYDVGRNSIVKVNNEEYAALQYICKYGFEKFKLEEKFEPLIYNKILLYQKRGYLGCERPRKICHPYTYVAKDYLEKKLHNVLLQITQMCNFRCSYCPYSGNGYFDRKHMNKTMSFETAKKAVDFVLKRSKYTDYFDFGFYGGEPLIHFELIRNIVQYIEEQCKGKPVYYSMTTNGFFLNDNVVEFLEKYKFSLTISLDGPKSIHDKNRRKATDGEGTFDDVYKNLKSILEKHKDYVPMIGINAVWDTEENYKDIYSFFQNDPVLKEYSFSIENVDNFSANSTFNMTDESYSKKQKNTMFAFLNDMGFIHDQNFERDENSIGAYKNFDKFLTPHLIMQDECHHNGPCLPGYSRLFVDVDGNLYPCEKVSNTSEVMRIGHVDKGFFYDKIYKLLNIGNLTEDECKRCWAIFLCTCCARNVDNITDLSRERKCHECLATKVYTMKLLKEYIVYKECTKLSENLRKKE